MLSYFLSAAEPALPAKGMEAIIAALTSVFSVASTCLTQMTTNEIMVFFLAAGLVPVGVSVISHMKNAARG